MRFIPAKHRCTRGYKDIMALMMFKCPNWNLPVPARFDDQTAEIHGDTFEPVKCIACGQFHHVSRRTGRVLGSDEKKSPA
jgi:hypothetical protein